MNDASRAQGGLICLGAVIAGALFLLGLARGSYWALALPVAIAVFFALGLTFWVGWTIATVAVEPESDAEDEAASGETQSQDQATSDAPH